MAAKKNATPIIVPPVSANNGVVDVSATPPVPTPDATPPVPTTPDATPAVQPIVNYPAALATTPAILPTVTLPTFCTAATPMVAEFNNAVTEAFANATARMAELGRMADDVLQAEFHGAKNWTKPKFDETFSNLRDQYTIGHPDSAADVRVTGWWKYHRFILACNDLGILGADTLPFGVVVNHLFSAALDMIQAQATTEVKVGWAEWLKTIVPMIVRGELSREIIVASIDGQRAALNAFDAKRFPMKAAHGGKARKNKTGSGRKAPKVVKTTNAKPVPTPATTTPATPDATTPAIPPTPAEKNATTPATPADATPADATPATTTTPDATPATTTTPATIGLLDVLGWLNGKGNAEILGTALADSATPDATVKAIYKILTPRMKAIKEASALKIGA